MFITVGDTKIFSISFGRSSDPTILGIGGWIGSWELWAEPFSTLSASWHTIAYDHRGSGATLAPVESISFDRLVDDVFVVLDAYKVESCVLAAESAGAAIALGAALKDPQRISGLVIVDGLYAQNTPEADDRFLAGLKSNYSQTLDGFVQACVPQADCEHIKRWGRQILERASPEAAFALYRVAGSVDLRSDFSSIIQPTLILHSASDRLVPLSSAQWLAKALPGARLTILNGSSHVPTMTQSGEIVQAIDDFFRS